MQTTTDDPTISVSASGITPTELGLAQGSRFPFWVYDFDKARILWANAPALAFWEAASLEELQNRDLARDMSRSVRDHLEKLRVDLVREGFSDELWSFYPNGLARQASCRFRLIRLRDGRDALLCEAQQIVTDTPEAKRATQAILFADAMVMIYALDGTCLYGNPAARRVFSLFDRPLAKRIIDRKLVRHLLDPAVPAKDGRYTSSVNSLNGPRLHAVNVRHCTDPVSALPALLFTEVDITDQEQARSRLAYLADHDPLTGLANRSRLERCGAEMLAAAEAQDHKILLILLDLVAFKDVNDRQGHTAGDQLLAALAHKLRDWAPQGAITARLGGDEFCLVLPMQDEAADPMRLSRALQRHLAQPNLVAGRHLSVRCRIGLAISQGTNSEFPELLRQADVALTQAKRLRARDAVLYREEMSAKAARFNELTQTIEQALRRGGFVLHYQPRVELKSGAVVGVEALIRLRAPNGGLVPPDEFLPAAEASGAMHRIGRWAIRQAVQDLAELSIGRRPLAVSINIDPRQFRDPLLLPLLRQVTAYMPGGAQRIELEVTESALLADDPRTMRRIASLQAAGFLFSVDDFGMAYSNFARLSRFPIHRLKIDRSVIGETGGSSLLKGMISMAHALKTKVVAEGVERPEQLELLRALGCDEYQGYLYSPPLALPELREHLTALVAPE